MKKNYELLQLYQSCRKKLTIMRNALIILLISAFQVLASGSYSQTTRLSLELKDASVKEVLSRIEHETEFYFFYNSELIDVEKKVNISIKNKKIDDVLSQLFDTDKVQFTNKDRYIIISPKEQSGVQKKTITGNVTDKNGEPLPGVTVVLKGTTQGTVTDLNGKYELPEVSEESVVVFSFVGMKTQEILIGTQSVINVTLAADAIGIEEVVAIGYGSMKKSDQTGAIASVKGDMILEPSSSAISEGMIGKIAGVDISSATYAGDEPQISIRGNRSLNASNNPLVIVDGVPGSLSTISSYDIESIEVLKDASTAAIYGTRAANGVILVTTKRGPKSGYNIAFNSSYGVNQLHLPQMMSGDKYAQFRRDGVRMNNGWENGVVPDENIFFPPELEAISKKEYYNWQDLMFRNGLIQQHNINIGYKTEKTSFNLSGTLIDQAGYIQTNNYNQYNVNFSIDHTLTNWLDFGATIRYNNNQLEGLTTPSNAEIYYMNPFSKPYDENGELIDFPSAVESAGYNILANTRDGVYEDIRLDKTMEYLFYLNLKPFDGLTFKTMMGIRDKNARENYFYGSKSFIRKNKVPEAGKTSINSVNYTFDAILNYKKSFGDHNFEFDGIFETVDYRMENHFGSGRNQPVEATSYHNLGTSVEDIIIGSDYSRWTLASVLGRIRYNYKNKYLFNVLVREDGSSRLSEGKKWSTFPGASAAWRISEENFLTNNNTLSNLKLRASFGTVGNSSVAPYSTLPVLKPYQYSWANVGAYYYNPSLQLSNEALGWEISNTIDLGLDMGLWENRLTMALDVYRTFTDNVILDRDLPILSGYTSTKQNIGQTQNKGIEIALGADIVRTSNIAWDIDLNYAYNKEEILKLTGDADRIGTRWFVGEALNVVYDYEFGGIWQTNEAAEAAKYNAAPGMIKIVDQNTDGKIDPDDDRKILGQLTPKHIAGLTTSFKYKNFDVLINANARWGHLISSETYGTDLSYSGSRWLPDIDYWTPENPTNSYPAANAGVNLYNYQETLNYMKGDFVRLRQIAMGYDFSHLLPDSFNMKKLRIYVQVNNPFYIYKDTPQGVHPEAPDLQYTIPTSYLLGINLNL